MTNRTDTADGRRLRAIAGIFRAFGGHLRKYTKWFAIGYLALLGTVLMKLAAPWPLKLIFDYILLKEPMPEALSGLSSALGDNSTYLLTVFCAAIVLIVVMEGIFGFANKYYLAAAGHNITNDIRRRVFNRLHLLPECFHKAKGPGDVIVRLTSDINALKKLLITYVQDFARFILTFVGIVITMLVMDWQLTLVALIVVPVLWLMATRFSKKVERVVHTKRAKESEVASIVQETISSMSVVKAFNQEEQERRRFAKESGQSLEADLTKSRLGGLFRRSAHIIIAAGTALVVWVGARRVLGGQATPGDLIVFMAYVKDLYKPISGMSDLIMESVRSLVCGARVAELLQRESLVQDAPHALEAPPFRGEVTFEKVSFGYSQNAVLEDISFTVKPGEMVALVGSSGTGKTTIVSLLLRFYDPWSGKVLIDGRDIRDFKIKSLREQMSAVLQDSVLLRRSIRENIAYGKEDASDEEVIAAARSAQAHDFISGLPKGYDTIMEDRGDNLSGGQRQRIALARAIIRKAPILILDEPEAGIDAITSNELKSTLARHFKGRTTFIIAHSLTTIKDADCILVVDDKRVVAKGTHDELLGQSSSYRRTFALQNSGRADI